jgi:hypothetical protein
LPPLVCLRTIFASHCESTRQHRRPHSNAHTSSLAPERLAHTSARSCCSCCSCCYHCCREGEESFGSDRVKDKAWRADKTISGGGVIIDGGSHTIRPMRMMMAPHCGNIVAVAAVTEAFDPDREGENYTRTLMRFENGQTACVLLRRSLS